MKNPLIFHLLIIVCCNCYAQDTIRPTTRVMVNDTTEMIFERPKVYTFLANVPQNWYEFGKRTISKQGLINVSALAATTALLVLVDRPAIDGVQHFGNYVGVDPERCFSNALKFKMGKTNVNALDIPTNLNSILYFIGEGWPSIALTAGVLTKGLITNDNRAILTASQFAEAYLALGVTVQLLKRMTGRESPFVATSPSGKWQFFPSYSHYQTHVPQHDAFPSGHLATAMATVTIYSENYPELKLIKPIGYSVIGLVGLAMMNNGVHWLSDYPLALAIGYTYGKIATNHGRTVKYISKLRNETDKGKISLYPAYTGYGTVGFKMSLNL